MATDPEEIDNVAESAPEVAAEMEKLIRSVVDIQAVDKECKEKEKVRFNMWFRAHKSDWVMTLGMVVYSNSRTEAFGSKEDLDKMTLWINGTKKLISELVLYVFTWKNRAWTFLS